MKKFSIFLIVALTGIMGLAHRSGAEEDTKWTRLVEECGNVLSEVQKMPDQSIPEDLIRGCAGIAVFPSTVSGGFIIGAKYGQGIIMVRDEKTGEWMPPAIFTMAGGSFGWQIGGQATDFILLIHNHRSVDGILQGKFKLGSGISVAAGPVGRATEMGTDIQLKGGIFSYSRSRGLFAGAKLEGAVITEDLDGDESLYGKDLTAREIMLEKKVVMPKCADKMLGVLKQYPTKSNK
jgi:lipid-binding SYLF domain-containing protein